ncbi:MAG: L-threonylcarbamoyladenylate synthase [Acidimicrobiia bacterium]
MTPIPPLDSAVEILRGGGLVAFPTETVYGLGADASSPRAVARVFEAKGRPPSHPLIVHIHSLEALTGIAREIPPEAWRLAGAFWPGPLTLVLYKSEAVLLAVTGGLDTVAVRVPAHTVALQLLERFGGAVVAPSANRFGRVSPTTASDVQADLGDRVDLVLDGGRCSVGVESTIVDLSHQPPSLLRPGGVSREAIEVILGRPLNAEPPPAMRAPGMLPSHYAPRATVLVIQPLDLAAAVDHHLAMGARVAVVGAEMPADLPPTVLCLAPSDPSAESFARALYGLLREADLQGCDVVLAVAPKESGIGLAIADRLRRAAGPRQV